MMKKILGIIASPRKSGNCEIVIKEISRQIATPHELNLLRLADFNILPCKGCYQCLFKEEECVLKDDFQAVLNAMIEADALIVAAPAYFLSANSSLKRLLDRGLAFYAHAEKLWGKPSVGIGTAGIKGREGFTLLCIESFLRLTFTENKQNRILYGALPGEVFMNEANKNAAAEIASALFSPMQERTGPCCPLCGGQTFRFSGSSQVLCMLCSNSGTLAMEDGKPVFQISKGEHEMFLSKADALAHKAWLIGMKDRFAQQKKQLKAITSAYRTEGKWIRMNYEG